MLVERNLHRRSVRGFFLIEAMVAILIFALGILGLVAMGGTAVSSQSDAQYRTEASSLANAIAGEIAISVDRSSSSATATSLAAFQHQPGGGNCAFSGGTTGNASVLALVNRAANAASGGLPGVTTANQQVLVNNAANAFNRVEITLCWKTASDNVMRRHTLVGYIN